MSPKAIFIGPDGWRAGWRFLLFFVVSFAAAKAIDAVLRVLGYSETTTGWTALGLLVDAGLTSTAVLLAMFVMARLESRSLSDYGLPLSKPWPSLFGFGLLWGFLASTIVLALILVFGGARLGGFALRGTEAAAALFLWLPTMMLLGLAEELLYRGYPLVTFTAGMGFWPAATMLSLLFGLAHLSKPNETALDITSIVFFGLFWAFTIRRTGSVWFAVGFHAMSDYSDLVLYAAPNTGNGGRPVGGHLLDVTYGGPTWLSGGQCGMEASVFSLLVVAGLFVVFGRLWPARASGRGAELVEDGPPPGPRS